MGAATDAERLAIVFEDDEDLLREIVANEIPAASRGFVLDLTPSQLAEFLLRLHGVETLKRLSKAAFVEMGLDPPERWGNTQRTRDFVRALGFSDAYLCVETQREPFVDVLCPSPLPALHDYQRPVYENLLEALESGATRRLLTLPTGAGKTRVAIETIVAAMRRASERGEGRPRVVVWVAHTDELCEQAVTSWERVWSVCGVPGERLAVLRLWGGMQPKSVQRDRIVVVTTNVSLTDRARGWLDQADILAIDEAHRSLASTYRDAIRGIRPNTPLLGLTATPFRGISDDANDQLARLFDREFVGHELSADTLIRGGYLSHVVWETLEFPHIWKLDEAEQRHIAQFEEISATLLSAIGANEDRNQLIIERVLRQSPRDKIMVFACNVAHAYQLNSLINIEAVKRGLAFEAAAITHETSSHFRRSAVERFSRADSGLNVLVNVTTLTMGFDAPQTNVLIIARPTFSPVLYQQMVGRGLRGPLNGGTERCNIVNTIDNIGRFGERLAFHELQRYWRTAVGEG